MNDVSMQEILAFSVVGVFLVSAFMGFLFRKVTVDYIEAQMAKEGIEPPLWDKGIGARIGSYAVVIVRGRPVNRVIVDDFSIIKYARKKDWYLAVAFLVPLNISCILAVILYCFYGPSE